jgi:hypothetical protein
VVEAVAGASGVTTINKTVDGGTAALHSLVPAYSDRKEKRPRTQ